MNTYDRHRMVDLQPVLTLIKMHNDKALPKKIPLWGQPVKLDGLRLLSFLVNGTKCSCCGLEAQFFAVERHKSIAEAGGGYHLNLYGIKDHGEVLFTHDHTLARGLGGLDRIENTTTMCQPCNAAKSVLESKEANRRQKEAEAGRLKAIADAKKKPAEADFIFNFGAYRVRGWIKGSERI